MKFTLHLPAVDGGPFRCAPASTVELEADRIRADGRDCSPTLPHDKGTPCGKLYVVGNEYGALGAVWCRHDGDAIDELVDSDLGGGLLIDEDDADEDTHRAGNAGEPVNLDNAWIRRVELKGDRDWILVAAFAEARGASADLLSQIL